jgi:hypothetical protein
MKLPITGSLSEYLILFRMQQVFLTGFLVSGGGLLYNPAHRYTYTKGDIFSNRLCVRERLPVPGHQLAGFADNFCEHAERTRRVESGSKEPGIKIKNTASWFFAPDSNHKFFILIKTFAGFMVLYLIHV